MIVEGGVPATCLSACFRVKVINYTILIGSNLVPIS
jgi:hypothetical protein